MLRGFLCPRDGKNREYTYCWNSCADLCMPLPVLIAFAKQMRPTEKDVYHVTEILNPPQQVWLARNNDYYVPPESLVDMHVGTSWHSKIDETRKFVRELKLQKEYIMEKSFKKEYKYVTHMDEWEIWDEDEIKLNVGDTSPVITLTGTPDLYVTSTDTIFDYKVMKYYYTLKYLKEGKWADNQYAWQLNIYRRFTNRKAKMKLFCYIKDWKRNFPERFGVNRTEMVEVPHIPDRIIESRVKELLAEHVRNDRDSSNVRHCTDEERWRNSNGECVRCENYCGVSRICEQHNGG